MTAIQYISHCEQMAAHRRDFSEWWNGMLIGPLRGYFHSDSDRIKAEIQAWKSWLNQQNRERRI